MQFARHAWRFLEGFRGVMVAAMVFALLHTLLSLVPAFFIREVIARLGGGGASAALAHWTLLQLMAALAAVYTVRAAASYLDRYLAHVAAWGMRARLRVRVYAHMQALSHRFFNGRQSGELAPRAIHDVKTVEYFLAHGLPQGVLSLLVPAAMSIILALINWRLTALMRVTVPLLVVAKAWFGRRLGRGYRAIHRLLGETPSLIAESVQGIEVIKAFNQTLEHTQDAMAASERVFEILATAPDIVEPATPRRPATPPERWDLRFVDVSFRYPGQAVSSDLRALGHVSFVGPAGTTTALVGHTGAGKSTVARLIPRFWDVAEGAIELGGAGVLSNAVVTPNFCVAAAPTPACLPPDAGNSVRFIETR